jgi:hypothetical protein
MSRSRRFPNWKNCSAFIHSSRAPDARHDRRNAGRMATPPGQRLGGVPDQSVRPKVNDAKNESDGVT